MAVIVDLILLILLLFFFFNDTATTEIYTLSLHDALPISAWPSHCATSRASSASACTMRRSEEHTSELQSHLNLVCRLLLEKKKKNNNHIISSTKKKKKKQHKKKRKKQ